MLSRLSPPQEYESAFRHSMKSQANSMSLSRKDLILARRVVFRWLPVHNSNDLVIGSWYFVYGSIIFTLISIVPLFNVNSPFWPKASFGSVSNAELIVLSLFFIFSGVFFAIGSLAFVRALRDYEDKVAPLFGNWKHLSTDELLGAWLYLLAMCPYPPYVAVYIYNTPSDPTLWIGLAAALFFVYAMYLFVKACYPTYRSSHSGATPDNIATAFGSSSCACLPRTLVCICGSETSLVVHVQNDWLIGCWVFYFGSLLFTLALLLRSIQAIRLNQSALIVYYVVDTFDFLLFTVGCAYFCAGSYPAAMDLDLASPKSSFASIQQAGFSNREDLQSSFNKI